MAATDDLGAIRQARPGLFTLLAHPRQAWPGMAAATLSGRMAFARYALPLAAIPALAKGAGLLIFGVQIYGVLFKPAPITALISAALTYGLELASVLILGFAIHLFSAVFNGESRLGPAMKLAVFSSVPGWFGGIFLVLPTMGVLPPLGVLSAAATFYGLYVLYLGLPTLMCVRNDLCPVFAGVLIAIFLALWGVSSLAIAAFDRVTMVPAPGATLHAGSAAIDVGKLSRAGQALSAAAAGGGAMPKPAATTDELESLLPSTLATGFTRTRITSSAGHLGNLSGAMAQGTYVMGANNMVLTVGDLGSAGALAQAVSLSANKHTATSYEKSSQTPDGRMMVEKYDRTSSSGEYDILIGERFLVQAKGRATMDMLQAAVQAIPFDRLEAMAKG